MGLMETEKLRLGTAPGRLPTLTHAWNLLRQPLQFLTSLSSVGDIVKIRLGLEWGYLVLNPELLHRILVTEPAVFDKGGALIETARLLVGNGLGTCPFADHRRQRRLLQPAFKRDRLAKYAAVMERQIGALVGSWQPGAIIEVSSELRSFMLAVVARTLFVREEAPELVEEVQRSMPVIFSGIAWRMFLPFKPLWKLPLPGNRRFDRAFTQIRTLASNIVATYRQSGVDHGDLLSTLLAARDEDTGKGMTAKEIGDQIVTLLVGGVEAPSTVLSWAFHLLGQNPEVERQMHAEVDRVLMGRMASFDDIPELDYTQRVLTETLRLYSPAWLLTRRTTADTELGGHQIARGTTILFSSYLMHRNPDFFPDPERFDPDRWLPDRAKSVPRFAMLPFGGGSRKCIGDAFGMTVDTLALASLAARWRLRPIPGRKLRPRAETTLNPGVMPMRVEARCPLGTASRSSAQVE